jgi:hypothetical protein
VLPLIVDVCAPSPRIAASHGRSFPPAVERLQSELVLGLAAVDHLFFERGLGFDEIVARLAAFAGRWLLVEYAPPGERHVGARYAERVGRYSLEGLVAALRKRFDHVELLGSSAAPQCLLLCERRESAAGRRGPAWQPAPESALPALDGAAQSLATLAAAAAQDGRFTRMAAVSARRHALVARRQRAIVVREEIEERLCRADLRDARREFLRVRPAYQSATKFAAATPIVMASPRLYAAILRCVRARRARGAQSNARSA